MISHLEFGIWVCEGMYLYPQFTDLFQLRRCFSLLKAEGRFLRVWMWLTKILPVVSSSSSSSEHLHFVAWLLLIHNLKFSSNDIACTDESVISAMAVNFFIWDGRRTWSCNRIQKRSIAVCLISLMISPCLALLRLLLAFYFFISIVFFNNDMLWKNISKLFFF